jgi:SAM-dependent methyltransferase
MHDGMPDDQESRRNAERLARIRAIVSSSGGRNTLMAPFVGAGGFAWAARLPETLAAQGDEPRETHRSPWRLFEDGQPIGRPHAVHEEISDHGLGAYSHWLDTLYFSTSDNSDPNTNGRTYELRLVADRSKDYRRLARESPLEWIPRIAIAPHIHASVARLADILRRRKVREVVYFHTDHFEPWIRDSDRQWRALERFGELTRKSTFGRKLTLFLTPYVMFSLKPEDGGDFEAVEGDGIVFWNRPKHLADKCRELLRPLEAEIGHEFQLHVHHENWTRTDLTADRIEAAQWTNRHSTPEADECRFELFLGLCKQTLTRDLGRPFDRWAFIHGNWTLSASDERYCRIDGEIPLLMRHGCFGDFTFPAPNPRVRPTRISSPYSCWPLRGRKAYDMPEADPRPIAEGSNLITPDRFFVWNSPIPAGQVSLDFFDAGNLRMYGEPEALLQAWLQQGVILGERLYIKTHAHSLHSAYLAWEDDRPVPHTCPDIVVLFELLQRACDSAKVPLVAATVNEVMALLRQFDQGGRKEDPQATKELVAHEALSGAPSQSVRPGAASPPPAIYPLKGPFIHRAGEAWIARLPAKFDNDADAAGAPQRSQWQLLEDEIPLTPAHASHSQIAELGGGRHSHWTSQLYFSTSDGTDPNNNGKRYALRWAGQGGKPWLAELTDSPVAEAIPFGPRPEVQTCAGLIAILGASFSGSTLVNSMLGAHPLIFGGGELHWLMNYDQRSECAICGKNCRFWTPEVRASASVGTMYHDIARMFGRPYIADISKMPSWYANSLKYYPDLPAVRVLLVKHPVRHVASFLKKKEEFSEYGDPASVLSELRTFYDQFDLVGAAGQAAPAASLSATGVDFIVRYEDFVASPEAALLPILAALGLSIHPRMQLWASAEHHHIGGNVGPRVQIANDVPALAVSVRKYRQRGIFLDNSYKEILTPADIELIAGNADARWIAQRFGYDLPLSEGGALSGAPHRPTMRPKATPAQVNLLAAPFRHREGFAWSCELPAELASEGDTPQHKYRSSWQLLEDGNPIGRSHAMHVEISDLGSGRHSHWGDTLYFSTSDNSDPNTNGRRYSLAKGLGSDEEVDAPAPPMSEPSTTARTDVASHGDAKARVDAAILDFLGKELTAQPAPEDSIARWYRTMYLERGQGFAPFGEAVIGLLQEKRGRFDRVTEIGAGLGQTCLQLALDGWSTIAVESGNPVYNWMERLLDRVNRFAPDLRARIRTLECHYPRQAYEYLDGRTLACFLGLCAEVTPEVERQMINALQLAGGIVLDPRVFFRHRETLEEQRALIDQIEAHGFNPPIPLWSATTTPGFFPYNFLYFERRNEGDAPSKVAADLDVDTFIPVGRQIERIRAVIGEEQPLRALFDRAISQLDIEANEELIRRHGRTRGLSDPKKYLDCAYWILQKLRLALLIGLDWRPPQRILDLGTGGGHFCFVCRLLGHEVVGVDIEVPLYREICGLMGVTPISLKIERNKPLPSLGRFDFVTAFAAQFDHVSSIELWSKADWRDFLDDLLRNHLRAPGRIFFTLNSMRDPATGASVFKQHVAEVFEEYGGRADSNFASVDLTVTEELVRLAKR